MKGILTLQFSTIKVATPALRNPANTHKAAPLTAAVTDFEEFPNRSHFPGWEQVADYALAWAERNATVSSPA